MQARSLTLAQRVMSASLAASLAAVVAEADEPTRSTSEALRAWRPHSAAADSDPVDTARRALEGVYRGAARCGLKLHERADPRDPSSYRIVVEASVFQLAFYADVGPWFAPLPDAPGFKSGATQISFPDVYTGVRIPVAKWEEARPTNSPEQYFVRLAQRTEASGQLAPHQDRSAEVVVYTLDGNNDGRVGVADRQTPEAASTKHNLDMALFRAVHGTLVQQGEPSPKVSRDVVARGVRVWLQRGDEFPNGDRPGPVFTYWLSERFAAFDLNADGDTEDELVFGDSNGDGRLDAAEQAALLGSNSAARTDLADRLDVDGRFAAAAGQQLPRAALLDRIRNQHATWSEADAKQFVRNAIVRADVRLLIEYDDLHRKARIRKQMVGRADFRNALMRLRGMTR
jgi:hypothetical protein